MEISWLNVAPWNPKSLFSRPWKRVHGFCNTFKWDFHENEIRSGLRRIWNIQWICIKTTMVNHLTLKKRKSKNNGYCQIIKNWRRMSWHWNSARSLQKFAVLFYLKLLGETEEGTHNVVIWPRTLDGARTDIWMKTELYSGRQAISKRTFTSSRTNQCLRKLIRQRAEACRHIFKIVRSDEIKEKRFPNW